MKTDRGRGVPSPMASNVRGSKTSNRKRIFVCSPLRGDFENNRAIAECICRLVMLLGHIPIAPHVYFTRFLDDGREAERKMGIASGIELLRDCDELWAFELPNITDGMKEEIAKARELNIPVMHIILTRGE